MLVARHNDDRLLAGDVRGIHKFVNEVSMRFQINRTIVNDEVQCTECKRPQSEDFSFRISRQEYVESIKPLNVISQRKTMLKDGATWHE